jgi:hypothetical protein
MAPSPISFQWDSLAVAFWNGTGLMSESTKSHFRSPGLFVSRSAFFFCSFYVDVLLFSFCTCTEKFRIYHQLFNLYVYVSGPLLHIVLLFINRLIIQSNSFPTVAKAQKQPN